MAVVKDKPAQSSIESDNRRQQILNAAQELIVTEGLEGFRIREVAQRAGMHHASLLYYFPNREALVRGIVERIVQQAERVPVACNSLCGEANFEPIASWPIRRYATDGRYHSAKRNRLDDCLPSTAY